MKKILLSMLTVGIVIGAGVAATQAFFADVEKSEGNTFTAGKLDLMMSSKCSYNGISSNQCGAWSQKDELDPVNDKFFNFSDIKPGDWGENTIGFKVVDNNAWMCGKIDFTPTGELAKYLNIVWWADDGNNIYDGNDEILYGGPRTISEWIALAGGTGTLPLIFADKTLNYETDQPNQPISGGTEKFIGVGWCFGNISMSKGNGAGFTCDGSDPANNEAQGGKVMGNLTFAVEQYRNNPDFTCSEYWSRAD